MSQKEKLQEKVLVQDLARHLFPNELPQGQGQQLENIGQRFWTHRNIGVILACHSAFCRIHSTAYNIFVSEFQLSKLEYFICTVILVSLALLAMTQLDVSWHS